MRFLTESWKAHSESSAQSAAAMGAWNGKKESKADIVQRTRWRDFAEKAGGAEWRHAFELGIIQEGMSVTATTKGSEVSRNQKNEVNFLWRVTVEPVLYDLRTTRRIQSNLLCCPFTPTFGKHVTTFCATGMCWVGAQVNSLYKRWNSTHGCGGCYQTLNKFKISAMYLNVLVQDSS